MGEAPRKGHRRSEGARSLRRGRCERVYPDREGQGSPDGGGCSRSAGTRKGAQGLGEMVNGHGSAGGETEGVGGGEV